MSKRIHEHMYTNRKLGLRYFFEDTEVAEGYLYSKGKYLTKIKPEDLPEHYILIEYSVLQRYISAKGIKQLVYNPCMNINHMFKDDYLYISYDDTPITTITDSFGSEIYTNYYTSINGYNIIKMLKAAEKYSNYNIDSIKQQIELKRQTFKKNFYIYYKDEVHNPNFFDDEETNNHLSLFDD